MNLHHHQLKKKIETHQQNSTTRLYAAIPTTFDDWPSDFASPYHRYNFPCHLVQCFFFKNAHSSIKKTKTATTTCGQEIFSSKKQTKKNLFIKAWDSLLGWRVVKKTKNRPENRFRRRRPQIQNPVFTAMYPLKIQFFLTRTTKKYQQKKKKFLFSVLFILKKKGKKFKRKKKS